MKRIITLATFGLLAFHTLHAQAPVDELEIHQPPRPYEDIMITKLKETTRWNIDPAFFNSRETAPDFSEYYALPFSELIYLEKELPVQKTEELFTVSGKVSFDHTVDGSIVTKMGNSLCSMRILTEKLEILFPEKQQYELVHNYYIFTDGYSDYVDGIVETTWIDKETGNSNYYLERISESVIDLQPRVELFPNPAGEMLTVKIKMNALGDFTISLTDQRGILQKVLDAGIASENAYEKTFNISAYAAGIYFISVKTPKGTTIEKLIKL